MCSFFRALAGSSDIALLNRTFLKCLAFLLIALAPGMPVAKMFAQSTDASQFCARATAQPLTPPTFAHNAAETELQKCDAAALYYGFDRPPQPEAALQCGYYRRAHPDPQSGDPFAGPGVLAMLYANGMGVARNYDLALRFVCENTWAAPAETEGRIEHLGHLRDTHATTSKFDLCDDTTSGAMQGWCASIDEKFADAKRGKELDLIKGQWPTPLQEAFQSVQKAESAFEEARSANEIDLSGSGGSAFTIVERNRLRDQFLINLQRFAKNDVPHATAATAQDVDRNLNLVYQQIQHSPAGAWQDSTIKPSGIRDTQRAWLKLRDAWLQFARLAYPGMDANTLTTQLTRLRLHQLRSLARSIAPG